MLRDTLLPFSFPAVGRKKVSAAFDGGRMTSDGGVMLLGAVERRIGLARIRYVVTNIAVGTAEWLYDTLYCARGQAENLIKLHKTQLASNRTSCRSPLANQMRLVLHTAAYWLMLKLRDAIPKPQPLASAEFTTLRMRLLKIAARITETATRVRIAFAAACPEAQLFASLARYLRPAEP